MKKIINQSATHKQRQVHRLLHLVELLQQSLEVKQETLHLFPSFLVAALQRHASHRAMQELAEFGEQVVHHVNTLTHLVSNLGGSPTEAEVPVDWSAPREPVSGMIFQEELAGQILDECDKILTNDWEASSQLKVWLQERLETVLHETHQHGVLFDRLFATAEPRYRDLVVERFRVTAIP